MEFTDKHIAITGAGSGLGRALAQALGAHGAILYLSDIDEESLSETVGQVQGKVYATCVDVSSKDDFLRWKDEISVHTETLDILFNNAGVSILERFEDHSIEDWEWVFGVNVWGVIHGTRTFLPMLKKSKKGRIVNISSIFGIVGLPGQSAYCASKFAVRGISEVLWEELKDVDVSVVHPGGIATNIITHSRSQHEHYKQSLIQFFKRHTLSPEDATDQILRGIRKGKKRIMVSKEAVLFDRVKRFLPVLGNRWCSEKIMKSMRVKALES
jgi:NADP-dependent 3-hydroxy acid dehydrogenase YdfG